jgi:outer membrane protein assembly factor BamB
LASLHATRGRLVIKNTLGRSIALSLACTVLCLARARGQGPGNWPIPHGDAGHSGWQKADAKLAKDTIAEQFKFLWKIKLEKETRNTASFSEPLLAPRLINAQGFKDLVLWGGTDTVYAVDSELGTLVWQKHFDVSPSKSNCGASNLGIVVEPPHVINFGARPAPGTRPQPQQGPVPANSRRLGGAAGGGGFGFRGIYILTGDGSLHEQVLSTGGDFAPPVKFLPVPAGISNGLNIEGKTLYTATRRGCGDTPNAVWAIDVGADDYPVASYPAKNVSPLVSMGPTLADGMVYLVTGSGAARSVEDEHPNSVLALTGKDLKVKDWYAPTGNDSKLQNLTPVAFAYMKKELLAAPGKDGSFVLLDRESLGGADHHTPLFQTPSISNTKSEAWGGMTNWQDASGKSWVLASVTASMTGEAKFESSNGAAPHGSIVAFTVEKQDGKTVLAPAWSSPDLVNPAPPVAVNGLVIALSQGDKKTRAKLYVLDGATGKELYASGPEITTYANMSGVSVGSSHAFFTTHDGVLYCFGIGMEH